MYHNQWVMAKQLSSLESLSFPSKDLLFLKKKTLLEPKNPKNAGMPKKWFSVVI